MSGNLSLNIVKSAHAKGRAIEGGRKSMNLDGDGQLELLSSSTIARPHLPRVDQLPLHHSTPKPSQFYIDAVSPLRVSHVFLIP